MLSLPRANVDARDPDSGWTALHFASRQGKLATVRVLIENQAFVGARAPGGRTPLHLAAGWGTYEVGAKVAEGDTHINIFIYHALATACGHIRERRVHRTIGCEGTAGKRVVGGEIV